MALGSDVGGLDGERPQFYGEGELNNKPRERQRETI
jgi:hypothetical protein